MMNSDKRILVIMPRFYDYANEIVNTLKQRGLQVDLIYEEPPRILFLIGKKIKKLFRTGCVYEIFNKWIYRCLLKKKQKYDFFLVIRGNILSESLIKSITESFLKKNARKVYYTWDSLDFLQHKGHLAELFDDKFSFDLDDVANNSGWKLLPLFYTDEYNQESEVNLTKEYDLVCVCSLNRYRYEMVKCLQEMNPALRIFRKFYIGRFLYFIKKVIDPFFRTLDTKDIMFKSMHPEEIREVYLRSKAILDVTYLKQSGLSMRTIEAIGMRKKIVTNNKSICNYDFFSDENVYVYDENCMEIPTGWLYKEFMLEEDIRTRYTLKNWLTVLLDDI